MLCAAENPWGASWGADGTILFGQGPKGISQVSASGGQSHRSSFQVDSKTESAHGPQMLPGGKAVLFTLASSAAQSNQRQQRLWDNAQIVVQSLDSGQQKVVVQGGTDARYVPTGHLIYVRQGTLFAVPFDPVRLVTTGSPIPVADGIRQAIDSAFGGIIPGGRAVATGAAQFAISEDGLFAYVPQDTAPAVYTDWSWVDRQGRETPLPVPDRAYVYPRISPDGTRVALDIRDQEQDIWVWDLGRETLTPITFDPATDIFRCGHQTDSGSSSRGPVRAFSGSSGWNRGSRAPHREHDQPVTDGFLTRRNASRLPREERPPQTYTSESQSRRETHCRPPRTTMVQLRNGRHIARRPMAGLPVERVGSVRNLRSALPRRSGRAMAGFASRRHATDLGPKWPRALLSGATGQPASGAASDVAMMAVPIESGPGFPSGQSNQIVRGSVLRRRERPHVRCHP